jgi:cytochrome bd ubiquinol oxidase subunit II
VLLGAALGNVLRGVPVGGDGWFALPLFESFSPRGALGVLDWYTVLCGVTALVAIVHHGALFLAWKTDGEVRARSARIAGIVFLPLVALWLLATVATARLAPAIFDGLGDRPLAWVCTLLFLAGLSASFVARKRGKDLVAFLGSSAFLLGLLAATAASVYPVWLRSTVDPAFTLTAQNAASSEHALRVGLWWWPVGFVLAVVYLAILFRLHRGRAQAAAEGEGY